MRNCNSPERLDLRNRSNRRMFDQIQRRPLNYLDRGASAAWQFEDMKRPAQPRATSGRPDGCRGSRRRSFGFFKSMRTISRRSSAIFTPAALTERIDRRLRGRVRASRLRLVYSVSAVCSIAAGILATDMSERPIWLSNWSAFSSSASDFDSRATTALCRSCWARFRAVV